MSLTISNRNKFNALPAEAGVGYKSQHFLAIQEAPCAVKWLEIHAENYMGDGGRAIAQLLALREKFPISCHGVGLSIGGTEPLDQEHLKRIRHLVEWLEPNSFSEHLAWSTHEDSYLADLLPLPYTDKTLKHVCQHIEEVQETLARPMLLENPSSYFEFDETEMDETEFLAQISERTGCGLLLDINNVHVSSVNRGISAIEYINNFPLDLVGEIHLGGHEIDTVEKGELLLIDNHADKVADPVWDLYRYVVQKVGPIATLIEWDNDVPEWPVLAAEADRASEILQNEGCKVD